MKRKRYATMYQKRGRWYADFRGYADCGGEREALIPDGARHATTDQAQAALLFAKRLQELLDIREGRLVRDDREPVPTLREYVPRHLKRKAASVAPRTLKEDTARLDALLPEWGDLRLSQITTRRINDLILERQSAGFAPQTVNHVVSALSSLLRHAVSDGYLPINPAHGVERPRITRPPAQWLESAEGHRLLVAAAELDADVNFHGVHCLEALIGSALLTGGRRDELLALLVEDVDFDAGLVHFRPNEYYPRRKSRHATRAVPLWPQLRRILVAHVGDRRKGLLFPGAQGHPLHDPRSSRPSTA
jgi:integrase